MKKILKSLLLSTVVIVLLMNATCDSDYDPDIKLDRISKAPLYFMPKYPEFTLSYKLIRYYDAESAVISWKNDYYAVIPFQPDEYHTFDRTERFLDVKITAKRRILTDENILTDYKSFYVPSFPIPLDNPEIINGDEPPLMSDFYEDDGTIIPLLANNKYYFYKLNPSSFPVYRINSKDFLTQYKITVEVKAKYAHYYYYENTLYSETHTRATFTSDEFYIFNEKPAIPKKIEVRYTNSAFRTSDGDQPDPVYNDVEYEPTAGEKGPAWAGPATDSIEVLWDTQFRFRKPLYKLFRENQLLSNDGNSTIETPLTYDNSSNDTNNPYFRSFVAINKLPVADYLKITEPDPGWALDDGENSLHLSISDGTYEFPLNVFKMNYDCTGPLFNIDINSFRCTLKSITIDGNVPHLTYGVSWGESTDNQSNMSGHKWIIETLGGAGEGSWVYNKLSVPPGQSDFEGIREDITEGDLARPYKYRFRLIAYDRVNNPSDTLEFFPNSPQFIFETPPKLLRIDEVIPEDDIAPGPGDEPVYKVRLKLSSESVPNSDIVPGILDYPDYFAKIESIVLKRKIEGSADSLEIGVDDSIFDENGTVTEPGWGIETDLDTSQVFLVYNDEIPVGIYNHNRIDYTIKTNFTANISEESTGTISSLPNYFPKVKVVVTQKGDDNGTVCVFTSGDPEHPEVALVNGKTWLGNKSTFRLTEAEEGELDGNGRDAEGDAIKAELWIDVDDALGQDLKICTLEPGQTPVSVDSIGSLSNGVHNMYIKFTDEYGNNTDEFRQTTPVAFTCDKLAPLPEFHLWTHDKTRELIASGTTSPLVRLTEIKAPDKVDADAPGAVSGLSGILFWNGDPGQSPSWNITISGTSIIDNILDITAMEPSDQQDIAAGNKGILIDVADLGIQVTAEGVLDLEIIWPLLKDPGTQQMKVNCNVTMSAFDMVENLSETITVNTVFDTEPPPNPEGLEAAYHLVEPDENSISVTFAVPDSGDLSTFMGESIRSYAKYMYTDTPSTSLPPEFEASADGAAEAAVSADEIRITVPFIDEWNKCIKIGLWAEDDAGNLSGCALYTVFSPAKPSTSFSIRDGVQDIDENGHIFMTLLPDDEPIAESQVIKVTGTGEVIQAEDDGRFIFNNNDNGLSGHTPYTLQLFAINQNGDERAGYSASFTPPNHNVYLPGNMVMQPGEGSFVKSDTVRFSWSSFSDYDLDTIHYRVFVRKEGDAAYNLLTIANGIEENELIRENFKDIFEGDEADNDAFEWYLEAFDVDTEGNQTGETIRVPETEQDSYVFRLDDTPPVVEIEHNPANEFITDESITVKIIEETSTPVLIYKIGDAESVTVETGALLSHGNGLYSYAIILPEIDGTHLLITTAIDSAGNTGNDELSMVIDKTPPETGNVALDPGDYVCTDAIIELGEVRDGVSGIKQLEYGFVTTQGEEPVDTTTIALSSSSGVILPKEVIIRIGRPAKEISGKYLACIFSDWAGNKILWTSDMPIIFDFTAPKVRHVRIENIGYYVSDFTDAVVVAEVTDEEAEITEISYAITGTENELVTGWFGEYSELFASITQLPDRMTTLPNGEYALMVKAVSEYGLEGTGKSLPFIVDTTPPEYTFTFLPEGTIVPGQTCRIKISGTDEESGISSYKIGIGTETEILGISSQIPGNLSGWLVSYGQNGEFIVTFPKDTIPAGYLVVLSVENGAGVTATNEGSEYSINVTDGEAVFVKDNGIYTSRSDSLQASWEYGGVKEVLYYTYEILDSGDVYVYGAATDQETTVLTTGLSLDDKETYRFVVTAHFTDSSTLSGTSLGITTDFTGPEFYSEDDKPALEYPRASTVENLYVAWNGRDNDSGIAAREVLVEKYINGDEKIVVSGGWLGVHGDRVSLQYDRNSGPMDLVTGDRVYVTVRLTNGAGIQRESMTSLILIDNTPPAVPFILDSGDIVNTNSAAQAEANWMWSEGDEESGIIGYQWALTGTPSEAGITGWKSEPSEIISRFFSDDPEFAAIPPAEQHLRRWYMAVRAINGAGIESDTGFSDGITFDATAPYIAEIKLLHSYDPADGEDLNYVNAANAGDLVLRIQAHEDIAGSISAYEAGFRRWDSGDEQWTIDDYTRTGNEGIIPLSGLTLTPGVLTQFIGEAHNEAGISGIGYSMGHIYDNTIPEVADIHGFINGDEFHFDWRIIHENAITPLAACYVALVGSGEQVAEENLLSNPYGFDSYIYNGAGLPTGEYRLAIKVEDRAGNSTIVYSLPVHYDLTPPVVSYADTRGYDEYISKSLHTALEIEEDISRVTECQFRLGPFENPGAVTQGWMSSLCSVSAGLHQLERTLRFNGYPDEPVFGDIFIEGSLIDKQELYLSVRVKNHQGLWSGESVSEIIITDLTPPETPILAVEEYTANEFEVEFLRNEFTSDDGESGVTHFRLAIVETTDAGAAQAVLSTIPGSLISELPAAVSLPGFTHMTQRFIAAQTKNGAGDWSEPGVSNMFTVDLQAPVLTLKNPPALEYIVNNTPYLIELEIDEAAEIDFELYDEENNLINVDSRSIENAGEFSYTFDVGGGEYGTYHLYAKQMTDRAGNIHPTLDLADIRLNQPPVITQVDHEFFPARPGLLDIDLLIDEDGDGIAAFRWFRIVDGTYFPLCDETPFTESAAMETAFEHEFIEDQRTEYEVALRVRDGADKESESRARVIVVNTRYGILWTDEVWTGDHTLTGDVFVPENLSLRIAGAHVSIVNILGNEEIKLDCTGTLDVESGSTLTLGTEAAYPFWTGIFIRGFGSVTNSTIQRARFGITALPGSSAEILNTTFENNQIGIRAHNSAPLITNCLFINNLIYGIKEDAGGIPVTTGCLFTGNLYDYYDDKGIILHAGDINDIQDENYGNN